MKKLILSVVACGLIVPTSDYGMRNVSRAVPRANIVKRDFSTKSWGTIWNNAKYYPKLWRSKLFNNEVIPSADIKIEKASISANPDEKKTVVINLSDPEQSSEWARKVISTWQPVKGTFKKFYEFLPWKHGEQKGGSYWQYLFGSAVVAYLTELFYESSKKSSVPFDYSLDGELAQTVSPKDFVALLHKHGLTVADAVEYQCKKKEEEIYKELTKVAGLTETDWRILQNIFELKKQFLQGHYNESNITFKGHFDPLVVFMIKFVFQKADIPYKVTVVTKNTSTATSESLRDLHAAVTTISNLKFSANEKKAEFTSGNINIELYLSNPFLGRSQSYEQLAALAHEATHLSNMHGLETLLFMGFLKDIKMFDANKIQDCLKLLSTIQEYQADVSILAVPEYAESQKQTFSWIKDYRRPDIYVPGQKLYGVASRAVALHKAEAELLANNSSGDKK